MRPRSSHFLAATWIVAVAILASPRAHATMPSHAGRLPAAVVDAAKAGAFALPEPSTGLSTSSVQTEWRVPVILVEFSDTRLQHHAQEFEDMIFDSTMTRTATGSAYDYYRWVSGGRLSLRGRVVAEIKVSGTRTDYGNYTHGLGLSSTPRNAYGMVREALDSCRSSVDWSEFDLDHDGYVDMLWVVHSGIGGEASPDPHDLWSLTSRMSQGWWRGAPFVTRDPLPGSTTQFMLLDRFTILPELSPFVRDGISEIGVFCHEFGHALGLPDLYDTVTLGVSGNTGPGNWSLMSSGSWGTNGFTPQYPSHLGAWAASFLGWATTVRPARDTSIVLRPLERGGTVLDWSFQGESMPEHFLVENRQRLDYDRNLLAEGALVYHIDDELMGLRLASNSVLSGFPPALQVVEADGHFDLSTGRNRGDPGDPFPGSTGRSWLDDNSSPNCRTFNSRPTLMALRDIQLAGDDVRMAVQVRSPGWLAPEDLTPAGHDPIIAYTPAQVLAGDGSGSAWLVSSELRGGRPQVILRSRAGGWTDELQLSHSTGAALDPTIARLPGGDLAVVWCDTRNGRSELWYRVWIRGHWMDERLLLRRTGSCRSPTLAADGRGLLNVAFQHLEGDTPRVEFLRFNWFFPGGQPQRVSPRTVLATSPALAITPAGNGYILWGDRGATGQRIWFSRFHPDSGLAAPQALAPRLQGTSQASFAAVIDTASTLYAVWHVSGPSHRQLHFQRRPLRGPMEGDVLIESRGDQIQNPSLALDAEGGLHLAFERAHLGTSQIRYRHWQDSWGWDAAATEVTAPDDGVSTRPLVVTITPREVHVFYLRPIDRLQHLEVRRRALDGPLPTARVTAPPPPAFPVTLGPNPLRAGRPLEIAWAGTPSGTPTLDLYDVTGRRVATVTLRDLGNRWQARLGSEITGDLASGVYFARLREDAGSAARLVVLR